MPGMDEYQFRAIKASARTELTKSFVDEEKEAAAPAGNASYDPDRISVMDAGR